MSLRRSKSVKRGGIWERTPKGDRVLRYAIASKATPLEYKIKLESGSLKDEIFQRFKHVGFMVTIEKPRGNLETLAVIPAIRDLVITPYSSRLENEYLRFATDLYVDSAVSFLGMRPNSWTMLN